MGKGAIEDAPSSAALETLIYRLRGRRVMLDADLARLYDVTTGRFNEAFKRNHERFPGDFAFQVTVQELFNLRSQIAISSSQVGESTEESGPAARSHGGRRGVHRAQRELELLVNRRPSPEHDAQARIPFPPGIEKTAVESRPLKE